MNKAKIKINRSKVEFDDAGNLWLCLEIPIEDRYKARGIVRVMSESIKQFCAEIGEYKKKRSLDANAYYWVLCGKLAEVMNCSPEEIYRGHIKEIGNYETICIPTKAVKSFAKLWKSNHTGRQISTRKSKIPGCTTVLAYYGSSDFDTQQMSRLIDNCIQDCKAVGVETMTPAELDALVERWDAHE